MTLPVGNRKRDSVKGKWRLKRLASSTALDMETIARNGATAILRCAGVDRWKSLELPGFVDVCDRGHRDRFPRIRRDRLHCSRRGETCELLLAIWCDKWHPDCPGLPWQVSHPRVEYTLDRSVSLVPGRFRFGRRHGCVPQLLGRPLLRGIPRGGGVDHLSRPKTDDEECVDWRKRMS